MLGLVGLVTGGLPSVDFGVFWFTPEGGFELGLDALVCQLGTPRSELNRQACASQTLETVNQMASWKG